MSQSNDICSSCTSVFHFYTFVWNFWSARSCLISRIRNDLKQFLYEEVTFSLPLLCLRAFQSCNCHVVISQTTSKTRTKVRAARAASLVFLIKPLYYILNYGDVIAVMSTNFPRNNNSNCFWNAVNRPSFNFPASEFNDFKTKTIREFPMILYFQSSRWLVDSQQLHVCHKCWHVILSYSQEL